MLFDVIVFVYGRFDNIMYFLFVMLCLCDCIFLYVYVGSFGLLRVVIWDVFCVLDGYIIEDFVRDFIVEFIFEKNL